MLTPFNIFILSTWICIANTGNVPRSRLSRDQKIANALFSKPFMTIPSNITAANVVQLNNNANIMDLPLMDMKECSYKTLHDNSAPPWGKLCTVNLNELSGSKRIMLVGNSYTPNIARMFIYLKQCQLKAKEMTMYARSGCEVLENTGAWAGNCANAHEHFQQAVAQVKPDILFISTRHLTPMAPVNGPVDTILNTEIQLLQRIEKNVNEKVYILDALPRPHWNTNTGIPRVKNISQDWIWDRSADYALARKRMTLLAKKCSKCKIIDVMPVFTKNGKFKYYDDENGIDYFVNNLHISSYGLLKMAHTYSNVCRKI